MELRAEGPDQRRLVQKSWNYGTLDHQTDSSKGIPNQGSMNLGTNGKNTRSYRLWHYFCSEIIFEETLLLKH